MDHILTYRSFNSNSNYVIFIVPGIAKKSFTAGLKRSHDPLPCVEEQYFLAWLKRQNHKSDYSDNENDEDSQIIPGAFDLCAACRRQAH